MKFNRIQYRSLNGRQKEVYNFHKVAGVLADYGFNCMKLADDWHGADFLAYQMLGGTETLKVQLKSRITIDKKYIGKDIWIAFPQPDAWYLIEHDILVEKVGQATNWLNTESWITRGQYSSDKPSPALLGTLSDNKFPQLAPLSIAPN